jgi:hypothetical protein
MWKPAIRRLLGPRPVPIRQREFAFAERSRRRERRFKRLIAVATAVTVAAILWASPWGRYGAAAAAAGARQLVRLALGLPVPRSEIDEAWRQYRALGIETSRRGVERVFAREGPAMRRLMTYAGLDPEHTLARWGNFHATLLFPSKVFEPDDRGRAYRFRPLTRSIWLRNLPQFDDAPFFFLVPDGPGLAEAIEGTPAVPVESSRQTTNSWGLRGPEPDLDAPLRGIVLGDSYMQGMLISDDETPPENLRRYLQGRLGTDVSVLNTGVLGYSPEQYYYSLVEFADRLRPRFVVVSVFTNDFGDIHEVAIRGKGDWDEGKYWLEKIAEHCRARDCLLLVVPVPYVPGMLGKRRSGHYPGGIANVLDINSLSFLDPTDDFVDGHLELFIAGVRQQRRPQGCPLFNDAIGDGHFSAAGSRLWAERVGRRLILLMDLERARRKRGPARPRGERP